MTQQELINKMTADVLLQHTYDLERACWRMIGKGQLFSKGWRLAVKVNEKTLKQTTLPIPPGDPVPAGFSRVLGP